MNVYSSRDGKALEKFLQDYFDGNLKRYLKSEPIPESNDGPVKVSVHIIPTHPPPPLLSFILMIKVLDFGCTNLVHHLGGCG